MKVAMTVPLTLSQGLVDKVTLCLQLGDQVPALQKLLQLLHHTKQTRSHTRLQESSRKFPETLLTINSTDRKVELLRLLLVGTTFGQARLAEIGFTESGLDRLHAVAVVEAFRDIIVLHRHHVLDGGQSGLHGFFHLMGSRGRR